ncbi:CHASE3 domain-containing protein [Bradyrhizobium sp. JYMT SZCCT0428]|uniref:sensor histidine kinase n=1 Tax=Bradyrhizobium sp. JYMT SZCCT0428 TaxID=2807673 RepID=UPI001BAB0D62|nr:CHASE3 domain-containing protein [Bradyrhizobium sp. JYMT SZCCT0428]MBR1154402.1 CHASE3 domain-containing protein [Bradyrhizobium sp. JYMT SZCCT0428]
MFIEKRLIVPFSLLLLITGFVALLAVVGMTVRLGDRANKHFDEVISTRDVRVSAVEIRTAVQSAESSQRGLLLTGNEIYLSPYDATKASANRQLDNLKRMLGADPQFKAVLQRLTVVLAEKFQEMDRTIALKGERKDSEALAIINTNRGKALMDEINLFVSGIVRSMDNRLTIGVAEQRTNAANLRWASVAAAVLIVLVVSAVAATLLTYTRELTQTQAKVTALNLSLEERVRARTAALARANGEIQQFAHLLSHDMRAPLVSIVGFTSELADGVQDVRKFIDGAKPDTDDPGYQQVKRVASQDMPEAIGYIRTSAAKLDNLLSAVLKISREGGRVLNAEVIDLRELVSSSSAAIQHQLSAAAGEVVVDLGVSSIVSDKLSLGQVIGNLLDNAVKYRAQARLLRIVVRSSALPNDQIALEIADNGRGIAPGDMNRIFELFRRVGKIDQPGEGVGLAYVRTLVGNLGGEVFATSELDKGTIFRVVLPREFKSHFASAA